MAKEKKGTDPEAKRRELPFFVLSLVCGSVTGSNGAWSVPGPLKSSVPAPRVSPAALGTRGETESVIAREGGGVRAAAARGNPRPSWSRVLKAPLAPSQLVPDSVFPRTLLHLRGREKGAAVLVLRVSAQQEHFKVPLWL